MLGAFVFCSFSLGKKKNQKVQASSMRNRSSFEVSYDELAIGRVFSSKGLRSETPLRAMPRHKRR
jgi:hypothetical protein